MDLINLARKTYKQIGLLLFALALVVTCNQNISYSQKPPDCSLQSGKCLNDTGGGACGPNYNGRCEIVNGICKCIDAIYKPNCGNGFIDDSDSEECDCGRDVNGNPILDCPGPPNCPRCRFCTCEAQVHNHRIKNYNYIARKNVFDKMACKLKY